MAAMSGLDTIESFLTLAEELNFRRTAERLHIDQSALTRRIQKLEQGLGFKLLERTTREVSLTPAGQSFYQDNAHLLSGYGNAIHAARRIAEGKTGLLRVAYMAFAAPALMPGAVSRFRAANPHIDVRLTYIRTQGQKLALANDEIDLGFLIGPFEHSEFHSLLLKSERLCLVAPLGHPLLRLAEMRPGDLAGADLILGDVMEWGEYRRHLVDMFSAEGVALNVKLEASNTLALIGLVSAGLGVTICPECLTGGLGPEVAVRPIQHPLFRSQTVLVWKGTNHSAPVRQFVAAAKQSAAPHPGDDG